MDKGKKILFALFWNERLWNNGVIGPEDIALAKEEGYLFDPPGCLSHEAALEKIKDLVDKIDPFDAANAFLHSLSTRDLARRSALGSYYYAKAIPAHGVQNESGPGKCCLCGWSEGAYTADAYNEFSFARHKWGGVWHTALDYALFDLEQFIKLPKAAATEADISIFCQILACVRELAPNDKAGKLRDLISRRKLLPSNRDEVTAILEILGICGILAGPSHPGYEEFFADEFHRAPPEHKNDMQYPVNHWRAKDGINTARLTQVFGSLPAAFEKL